MNCCWSLRGVSHQLLHAAQRPFRIRPAAWGMVERWRRKLLLRCRWSRVQLFALMSEREGCGWTAGAAAAAFLWRKRAVIGGRPASALAARFRPVSTLPLLSAIAAGWKQSKVAAGHRRLGCPSFLLFCARSKVSWLQAGSAAAATAEAADVLCLSLLLREGEGQEPGWVKRSEVN